MTLNVIEALTVGIALGGLAANGVRACLAGRDANRAATEAEAAVKRAAGDHYLSSFRLYRLQHWSQA